MNPLVNETFINCVFPSIEMSNQLSFRRVGNTELYSKIASVCREWQEWVFSNRGPFRVLKNDIAILIKKYVRDFEIPQEDKTVKKISSIEINSLRRAMGSLNEALKQRSMDWFDYIDSIKLNSKSPEPLEGCPNIFNDQNETPFSQAVSLVLRDNNKYGFLFQKLYDAGVSANTIGKALPIIFL